GGVRRSRRMRRHGAWTSVFFFEAATHGGDQCAWSGKGIQAHKSVIASDDDRRSDCSGHNRFQLLFIEKLNKISVIKIPDQWPMTGGDRPHERQKTARRTSKLFALQ